jgi:hypothetical protein
MRLHQERWGEIDLVDDDERRDVARFGGNEQPVEELQDWRGVGGGNHHGDLIDIGGNGTRAAPAGDAAIEYGLPRFDRVDAEDILGERRGVEADAITRDGAVDLALGLAAEDGGAFDAVNEDAIRSPFAREDDADRRQLSSGGVDCFAISSSRIALTS